MENNKELTPMMELIEYIEEFTPKNKTTDGIWAKAKSLLATEKKIIEDVFEDGQLYYKSNVRGKTYYNIKFNEK